MRGSRLFCYGALEPRDELDERLEKCHGELSALTANLRESDVYDRLNKKVSRSAQDHEEISMALLFSILADPTAAPRMYHMLTLVSQDSLGLATAFLERIIMEKMGKLQDTTRVQVLWLTREMVQTGVAGTDKLCFAILKQLPAGSTSSSDIYIAESLLHILLDNREWLESQSALVSSVVYTYLSLLPSHNSPSLTALRDIEAQLCVSLIRNRFLDCLQIGRDLVRLLQAVAKIPEVTQLWRDLIHHPQKISPHFTGLQQILSKRTSRRFIAGRIIPDIEIKLNFLLSKVRFGQHKRYQEWFQKKYLSTLESQQQIAELIRYICCVIHPPNEVLSSDIFPRWALVGWLLSLCQSNPVVFSNAKLALLYDWLAYNPETDNIMNVEPGILLMFHSLRSHPQISATLLDFLCKLIPAYSPGLEQFVGEGVKAALRDILQKGVLLSLEPLFGSLRLDDDLRALVKTTFPEFFIPEPPSQLEQQPRPQEAPSMWEGGGCEVVEVESGHVEEGGEGDDPIVIASDEELEGEDIEVTAAFSDSEEGQRKISSEGEVLPTDSQGFLAVELKGEESRGSSGSNGDPWARVGELPEALRDKLMELRDERESKAPKLLDEFLGLLHKVCRKEDSSDTTLSLVAVPLADYLSEDLGSGCASEPGGDTEDNERPVHCFLRNACSLGSTFTPLLVSLHSYQPKVGYFFLHYLHTESVRPPGAPVFSEYRDFASGFDLDLKSCLLRDMTECVENEPNVFYGLLPPVYKEFSEELIGSEEMVNLIVARIDPAQLHSLIQKLMMKHFLMFGRDPEIIAHIIVKSLQWDSFEQFCLWQLLNAEGPDSSLIIPALANLSPEEHPEAISSALLFLKNEPSGFIGIGALLSLPPKHNAIVDVVASRWINGRPVKYGKYISQFLESNEKRKGARDPLDILRVVLDHLERLLAHFSNKQVFEGSELMLTKSLMKTFHSHPELSSRCKELHKVVSGLTEQSRKEVPQVKKSVNPGDRSSRVEPKPKKRRVINKEELTD